MRALQMRLAEHRVSFGHWSFLRILWEGDGLTQRELSERAGVMEPTTFSALKAMERLGYIQSPALSSATSEWARRPTRRHRGDTHRAADDHRKHGAGRTGRRHAHAVDPRTRTVESRRTNTPAALGGAARRARDVAAPIVCVWSQGLSMPTLFH